MPNWIKLASLEELPNPFSPPWFMVIDVFDLVDHLKFTVEGKWWPITGLDVACGPDGYGGLAVADSALVLTGCPVGALIGKFGGSSASLEAAAAPVGGGVAPPAAFAIGSQCVLPRPVAIRGPLFIGFNSRARPIKVDGFKLLLEGATLG